MPESSGEEISDRPEFVEDWTPGVWILLEPFIYRRSKFIFLKLLGLKNWFISNIFNLSAAVSFYLSTCTLSVNCSGLLKEKIRLFACCFMGIWLNSYANFNHNALLMLYICNYSLRLGFVIQVYFYCILSVQLSCLLSQIVSDIRSILYLKSCGHRQRAEATILLELRLQCGHGVSVATMCFQV